MKVLLITSSDERCGIAEYGKNLICNLPDIEWTVIGHREIHSAEPLIRGEAFDVVHLNYQPGLFPYIPSCELALGNRKVITLHNSHEGMNRNDWTPMFDTVVVHEDCMDVSYANAQVYRPRKRNFRWVPMGISKLREVEMFFRVGQIGSAGFPFPYKGFQNIAAAATILGMTCGFIMPDSPHWDRREVDAACRANCPGVTIVRDWMSEQTVIASLRSCAINVFAYSGEVAGISAAVRMGLAAGRPIVLTRCRQFRDLFDYEDEIEFIPSNEPAEIAEGIKRVLANGKVPNRVLTNFSWERAAGMYRKIYGGK